MAHLPLRTLQWQFWRSQRRRAKAGSQAGFTLVELLVTVFISSGIIAGLMFLVTELTSTNQREAARNETQRDMQNALDYMAADLREAAYVYTGDCIEGFGNEEDDDFCPGILENLPDALTDNDTTPVIAFWKNDLLPSEVREQCSRGNILTDDSGGRANCSTGHAYSLIVYSLDTANPNDTWRGRARITRYELAPFNSNGGVIDGYIPPETNSDGVPLFRSWPLNSAGELRGGDPTNTSAVLVDFVDQGLENSEEFGESDNPCPSEDYNISPSDANFRSFYACILEPLDDSGNRIINDGSQSVDVLVHLRGNAFGKAGILNENSFITGLETRVFTRSAVGRSPGSPAN